jgi:flagellar assembly protein FliH
MLSRIVGEEETGVAPLAWRSRTRSVPEERPRASEPPPPPPGPTPEQINAMVQQQARQAHDAGYREGEAAGRRKAEEQLKEAVEKLALAATEVAGARNEALRRAEADMVQLSIEVARRILHRELTVDTAALEALIRAALEKLSSQEIYRVRVHPDLESLVRSCLHQIGRDANIEVVGDPLQPRGGAVFEISRGVLDASVETQLREIERGLADQLENRP